MVELLSEVVKNVAERLERVDEEDEHELRIDFLDHSKGERPQLLPEENGTNVSSSNLADQKSKLAGESDSTKFEDEKCNAPELCSNPGRVVERHSTVDCAWIKESQVVADLRRSSCLEDSSSSTSDDVNVATKDVMNKTEATDHQQHHGEDPDDPDPTTATQEPQACADLAAASCCDDKSKPVPVEEDSKLAERVAGKDSRKRPNSLKLRLKCGKRKKVSGSRTPDLGGQKTITDFFRPKPADSRKGDLTPDPVCTVIELSDSNDGEEENRSPLQCDDFEDEIAACNDFEEVDVPDAGADGEQDGNCLELDPLFLSDDDDDGGGGNMSSMVTLKEIEVKNCSIDVVDLFDRFSLASLTCCGCLTNYSGSTDLISFDLKSKIMFRVCGLCSWWTSRRCSLTQKHF